MTVVLPPRPNSLVQYVVWVLAHDAGAEPAARGLMEAAESDLFRAHGKPGRFLDDMALRARRLPPAHLPPFWDSVAHRMSLAFPQQASRAYALARKAERDHALPVETDRHRENVLLFARAGALPAVLTALAADGRHLQGKHLFGPFCRLISPRPLHELFAQAWAKSPSRQGG